MCVGMPIIPDIDPYRFLQARKTHRCIDHKGIPFVPTKLIPEYDAYRAITRERYITVAKSVTLICIVMAFALAVMCGVKDVLQKGRAPAAIEKEAQK
jgi:hypothetical protein